MRDYYRRHVDAAQCFEVKHLLRNERLLPPPRVDAAQYLYKSSTSCAMRDYYRHRVDAAQSTAFIGKGHRHGSIVPR
jgi:hypothetical protein